MQITYNCALEAYMYLGETGAALDLLEEIKEHYDADIISYSSVLKGLLCRDKIAEGRKILEEAFEKFGADETSEMFNYFLEKHSNKEICREGVKHFMSLMNKGLKPNPKTFGVMVKIFGFTGELNKADDLLHLMEAYDYKPNLIYFTNLVHISFYNRKPRHALKILDKCKEHKIERDSLFYSKLISGMIRFNKKKYVPDLIEDCLKEKCGVNP